MSNRFMIVGHQKQWEFFCNKIEQNQLAHAYLFCGQNQIGKKAFTIELVKLLNCKDIKKNKPCGVCRSCIDIEKGNHPDFLFVRAGDEASRDSEKFANAISYNTALPASRQGGPDLKAGDEIENKHEIEIYQMRKAQDFLSLKSYYGGLKVVVVDNAEKMSVESQNCFLKTLEEPKGDTVIILITSLPERLLTTIFSRCQTVKFFPVSAKEIQKYLLDAGCLQKKAGEFSDMADGRPGRAIEVFLNPKKLEKETEVLEDLIKVMGQSLAEKFAYTKNLKEDGGNVKEILEIIQKYFRHLLLQKTNSESNGEVAFYPKTPDNLKSYSIEKLVEIIKLTENLISKLSLTNASPKLALEILLLELA